MSVRRAFFPRAGFLAVAISMALAWGPSVPEAAAIRDNHVSQPIWMPQNFPRVVRA